MAAHHTPTLFTPEQYLEMERKAEYKSEYFNGEIFAMAGASYAHCLLISNLHGRLFSALQGKPCRVGTNDLRVLTRPRGLYTYPDVFAVCGEPRFADERPDTLLNPVLIIEVLSPSTEKKDRGFKFSEYRQMQSLRQYVLVSQYEVCVEVYTRNQDDTWTLSEHKRPDSQLDLSSVGCVLKVGDIYESVTLEPEAEPSA